MKIEEVIHVMADVSETLDLEAVHQDAAELREAMKALEQHHKGLMGLVEAWRTRAELNTPKWGSHDEYSLGISRASDWCADELESLINPKD